MKTKSTQAGQAGLVVMLIMVVLLTLGVSIATRSTQDVSQSTQEQETSRVFDAAEAGIEQALSGILAESSGTVDNIGSGLSASYTIAELNELQVRLDEGHVVEVDISGYSGTVDIDWSRVSDCGSDDPASIEASVFDVATNTVRRFAFEGCPRGDSFLSSLGGVDGYVYRGSLSVNTGAPNPDGDFIRIRPVYNDTHLQVTGGAGFPPQYHRINSVAENTNSGETRAVEVDRTIPTAPAIFDYVLFAGQGNLSK